MVTYLIDVFPKSTERLPSAKETWTGPLKQNKGKISFDTIGLACKTEENCVIERIQN